MSFYPELYKSWQAEIKSPHEVRKLDLDFYDNAKKYLDSLKGLIRTYQDDELLVELLEKRLKRATYLRNDLINLRVEKHINNTLILIKNGVKVESTSQIPHQEKRFKNGFEKLMTEFQEDISGKEETIEPDENTYTLLEIVENQNNIAMGTDEREYGPFMKGDIVFLPSANALIIENKDAGKRINFD